MILNNVVMSEHLGIPRTASYFSKDKEELLKGKFLKPSSEYSFGNPEPFFGFHEIAKMITFN